MHGDDDFAAWFRLLETPGLGRESARRLLAGCGSPEGVLRAPLATLKQLVGAGLAQALMQAPPGHAARLANATRWRTGGSDRHVLVLGDAEYPAALLQTADPPLLLYVQGRLDRLAARSLAIVGSRHPTPQGAQNAHAFAAHFSQQGWVVVSGLARGIDTAAHEASCARGTVAVLAGGPDCIYPAQNKALLERLLETGAAISEMPMGWEPRTRDFPRRNRLISGLSLGVVVVEAARGSGSLITARFALEQGREVFAVPGSPLDPRAAGVNDLIRQGATLCSEAAHVIEALQPQFDFGDSNAPIARDSGAEGREDQYLWDELPLPDVMMAPAAAQAAPDWGAPDDGILASPPDVRVRLLELLGPSPVFVDDLIRQTASAPRDVQMALLDLELDGLILRHAGQKVSRCP